MEGLQREAVDLGLGWLSEEVRGPDTVETDTDNSSMGSHLTTIPSSPPRISMTFSQSPTWACPGLRTSTTSVNLNKPMLNTVPITKPKRTLTTSSRIHM